MKNDIKITKCKKNCAYNEHNMSILCLYMNNSPKTKYVITYDINIMLLKKKNLSQVSGSNL